MAAVRITQEETLGAGKTSLKRYTYQRTASNGELQTQKREVFDHGNAATVLLYNPGAGTVILTRQFRLPTYLNGNPDGLLLETPAGLLEDGEAAEETMRREIREETGYAVDAVQKIFEAYPSAGAFTELIHFYTARYRADQKVAEGGGLKQEGEDLEVLELPFTEALQKMERGEIRDLKTITLLLYAQQHRLFG